MYPRNYYAVLRVPEDADPAAVRHAYRVLAHRYHPDAGSGSSPQKFRDATEAYDVLSDPERRHKQILIWRGAERIRVCNLSH
jgi:molecular chaperone DnaJ